MSKLEIIAWLLFASFGGVGGLRSDLSLFIMAGNYCINATNLCKALKIK